MPLWLLCALTTWQPCGLIPIVLHGGHDYYNARSTRLGRGLTFLCLSAIWLWRKRFVQRQWEVVIHHVAPAMYVLALIRFSLVRGWVVFSAPGYHAEELVPSRLRWLSWANASYYRRAIKQANGIAYIRLVSLVWESGIIVDYMWGGQFTFQDLPPSSNETADYIAISYAWKTNSIPDDVSWAIDCLLYTSPSPRDGLLSRMPSSA